MVRPQALNGKSLGDEESQRKLLGGSSGWSSDEDSEIEFDASRVLEKPLSIKAKPNTRNKRPQTRCAKTEASLATILTFAIIVIFLLMGTLGWMYLRDLTAVCMLIPCIQSSAHISELMNMTAPPCDDFYNFACGSFNKLHPVAPNKASSSWFNVIRDRNDINFRQILESPDTKLKNATSTALQKLKVFYRSCMDEKLITKSGFSPIKRLIKKHGGWTMTKHLADTKWTASKYNLTTLIVDAHRVSKFSLFKMVLMQNQKTGAYVIEFKQHGLTFGDEKLYTGKSQAYLQAMIKMGADLAILTGMKATKDIDEVRKMMADVFKFEMDIAKLYPAKESINDPWKMYNMISVDELKKTFNNMIDLDVYLEAMFGKKIPSTEKILVSFPDYFSKLAALVKKTKKETIANYIIWHQVEPLLSYMTDNIREAHVRMFSVKSGVFTPIERWKFCTHSAATIYGFALSALYIRDYAKEKTIKMGKTIIHYVQESLKEQIKRAEWMDDAAKKEALVKLAAMGLDVGYPSWILDQVKLDEHYANLSVSDQLVKNILYDGAYSHEKNMKRLGTKPDKTEWHIYPHEQNAYYSLTFNKMVVPAGLMEPPFLDTKAPMAFNFGSLGMFIGHEMTHGFDVRGRNYDQDGILKHWWSKAVLEKFKKLSQCVMNVYGNYSEFGVKLNSKYTVNENIADDGGLKIALKAYERWYKDTGEFKPLPGLSSYTAEQLFFIGFGQTWCTSYRPAREKVMMLTSVHPPHELRVRGAISNSDRFAKAFGCKENSPMNPKNKCDVWGS